MSGVRGARSGAGEARVAADPRTARAWHQRAPRAAIGVAVLGSLLALALLALLLAPALYSALAAVRADGGRSFAVAEGGGEVAAAAEVVPEADWSVQPDPSGSGLMLTSPDRILTVRLSPGSEAEGDAALSAASGEGDRASPTEVLTETLASGLVLRHLTVGDEFVGVLALPERPVLVRAAAPRGADLETYRAALARLLESVRAG